MFLRNIFHKIITGLLSPFVISLLNVEMVESKTIPFLLLPEYTYNKNKPFLGFFTTREDLVVVLYWKLSLQILPI